MSVRSDGREKGRKHGTREVKRDTEVDEAVCEARREGVHAGKEREVVRDGVRGCEGKRARLADSAAEELAEPLGLVDQGARADKDAADGGAETLGETQRHRVEGGARLVEWHAGLGGDVPQARAVAVQWDRVQVERRTETDELGLWEDHCARAGTGVSVGPPGEREREQPDEHALPLSVFSTQTSLVIEQCTSSSTTHRSSTSSVVMWCPLAQKTLCTGACEWNEMPPASETWTWARESVTTLAGVASVRCVRMASWLDCGNDLGERDETLEEGTDWRRTRVPEAQKSPASLPAMRATRSSSSRVSSSSCRRGGPISSGSRSLRCSTCERNNAPRTRCRRANPPA